MSRNKLQSLVLLVQSLCTFPYCCLVDLKMHRTFMNEAVFAILDYGRSSFHSRFRTLETFPANFPKPRCICVPERYSATCLRWSRLAITKLLSTTLFQRKSQDIWLSTTFTSSMISKHTWNLSWLSDLRSCQSFSQLSLEPNVQMGHIRLPTTGTSCLGSSQRESIQNTMHH